MKPAVELIEHFAKLLCPSDRRSINKPFYKNNVVYITDGRMALCIDTFAIPLENWARYDGNQWLNAEHDPPNPERIQAFIQGGDRIDNPIPEIEPLECWKDPFKEVVTGCDECDGSGVVICNYDHDHDCPECNATGKRKEFAIEWGYYSKAKERTDTLLDLGKCGWFDRRYLWIVQELAKERDLTYELVTAQNSITITSEANMLKFSFQDGKGCVMGATVSH